MRSPGWPTPAEARALVKRLQSLYDADGSSFQVEEIAGGYQLLTRAKCHPWLARLKRTGHELRLTPAALETLAVVAYKQPIMRAEVEKVRGVACGEVVRQLMEKGLVRVAGRHDSLGRPQLYGTTQKVPPGVRPSTRSPTYQKSKRSGSATRDAAIHSTPAAVRRAAPIISA